jgi:short subunit dehydrogenase-like uncharacterized protein
VNRDIRIASGGPPGHEILRPEDGRGREVAVYGAYGHTGRFVVAELLRRGWTPLLGGRDAGKLCDLAAGHGLEVRPASVDDPAALDHALRGAVAVINCAGPFLDTSAALIEAAVRARVHYLDVTAEQPAARAAFEHHDSGATAAGISVMPAMAFYGGLGDLLATAAMGDWTDADRIDIAVALDGWRPTAGTRVTGARNTAARVIVADHRLVPLGDPSPTTTWPFPPPFGTQEVVALPLSEIVTIARHLHAAAVCSYMNRAPLADLRDPATPPPSPADPRGRSAQLFAMEAVVRRGGAARRASARGRDIYAFTAPLVVEAMERLLAGGGRPGVVTAGEVFDAADFLASLRPELTALDLEPPVAARAGGSRDRGSGR